MNRPRKITLPDPCSGDRDTEIRKSVLWAFQGVNGPETMMRLFWRARTDLRHRCPGKYLMTEKTFRRHLGALLEEGSVTETSTGVRYQLTQEKA